MITKTKKTLDYIEIEAVQLHNLTNIETGDVDLAPTARVSYELADDGLDNPPDVYDIGLGGVPSITLDGTGSTDPQDGGLTYEWIYDEDKWENLVGDSSTAELELRFTGTSPDPLTPQVHNFRLKVSNELFSHISNPIRIYIVYDMDTSDFITVTHDYPEGWNLASCPVDPVLSNHPSNVFPGAVPGTYYTFTGVYDSVSEITPGEGYWVRFTSDTTVTFFGLPVLEHTYQVAEGWNLIGGISEAFSMEDFNDPNGIIVAGTTYGYNLSYALSDVIQPGLSYWVRMLSSGELSVSI